MSYVKDKVNQIVEEYDYYDPNTRPLTEEELSEIVDKYGGETVKNEEAYRKNIDVLIAELEAEIDTLRCRKWTLQ